MIGIIASLMGSKVGRWIASGLLFVMIVAYVIWNVFNKGQRSAQVEAKLNQLEAIRNKVKTDDEIRSMPADQRRAELRKWVRN